jgi:hypothetical protein
MARSKRKDANKDDGRREDSTEHDHDLGPITHNKLYHGDIGKRMGMIG